jgi:hypothetical protein
MTEAEFETQKDSLVEQLSRGHDVCLATYATWQSSPASMLAMVAAYTALAIL